MGPWVPSHHAAAEGDANMVPRNKISSFSSFVTAFKQSEKLNPVDVAHLERWLDHERAEEIWNILEGAMRKRHGDEFGESLGQIVIREILGERHAAHDPDLVVNYWARADDADSLARFFNRLPPPVLMRKPDCASLARSLSKAAQIMRKQAATQKKTGRTNRARRSPRTPRTLFMAATSNLLKEFSGRFLDEVTVVLTDVAFPKQQTTIDQVRSARRPTTRGARGRTP